MKPFIAPLFHALVRHVTSHPTGFHVPGHHGGQALKQSKWKDKANDDIIDYFYKIMQIDVTELSSTDDLHHPEASIQEAQQLAAHTFGAEETYFLVGGSTSGNIALLLTVCEPDDIIIVQRNVHKSILNGLKLAGAKAVFLTPQVEPMSGLATIPTVLQVEEALVSYPEAKAVLLSNPNYYGMGVKLRPYVEAVHRKNKPILIDEAHGAHFGMHPSFPNAALSEGVDAVVQSAHKTLPTLTMGALLHIQGNRISRETLRQSLAMIQSSSPSFPILASMDISRAMIDTLGEDMFQKSLDSAAAFRKWLSEQQSDIIEMKTRNDGETELYFDPLRIVLHDKSGQRSGFELQKQLEQQGCFAEMADPRYVVLVLGIQTSLMDIRKLHLAIEKMSSAANRTLGEIVKPITPSVSVNLCSSISEPVSFARGEFKKETSERILLHEAEHHISAEMVTPYPPGIAILYPGEKIKAAMIEHITQLAFAGTKFQGAADPKMQTIAVYPK
ncbi:aminotransferase class I/II-fold pyridoxal phosphate-dependent enzyme [Paenibacillus sp. LHD-38]|uniref:aminotransferase class I/II-fold pyridoxal phosphate-dependent enzyme n=1 Tax=Paenibacillus sp. LHD-38 TaxID=3072143 RepID=UPI00280D9FE4|nr:aminotransferase class I/II-fold pyridoxal phosphate-dependent enzyme [Paenibacillus sp. LHD-38]MDQ8737433.1 aminotransferase class I/II-fold pyridoxal phosphate-dependent enzyme [Paenibacillus sp. LHD-38]